MKILSRIPALTPAISASAEVVKHPLILFQELNTNGEPVRSLALGNDISACAVDLLSIVVALFVFMWVIKFVMEDG